MIKAFYVFSFNDINPNYYNYEIINAKIFTINVKSILLICNIYIRKIC